MSFWEYVEWREAWIDRRRGEGEWGGEVCLAAVRPWRVVSSTEVEKGGVALGGGALGGDARSGARDRGVVQSKGGEGVGFD